jgi:hypothetical protein
MLSDPYGAGFCQLFKCEARVGGATTCKCEQIVEDQMITLGDLIMRAQMQGFGTMARHRQVAPKRSLLVMSDVSVSRPRSAA